MAQPQNRDPNEGIHGLCCLGGRQPCSILSCSCALPASSEPQLDLGKKMSTTHDLMIEELSLPNSRGSRLFQQRQKRVQRFVFEHPSGSRQVGLRTALPSLLQPFREGIPDSWQGQWSLCGAAMIG